MLIPTNKKIYSLLKNQLALDFNCKPEDFDKTENVITLPALNKGRRVFSNEKFFLQIATLGDNAVISADEKLHPWLTEIIYKRGCKIHQCNPIEMRVIDSKHLGGNQGSLEDCTPGLLFTPAAQMV